MKGFLKYTLLIILFIILVASITLSKLILNYQEKGTFELNRTYSDVLFSNIIINEETVSIKVDNNSKSIHIMIPNLKELEFDVDLKNIGNKDVKIKNFSYSNIVSNANNNEVEITSSLKEGDIISGSGTKKLNVKIKYKGKSKEKIYYNFNINYVFEEVNL